MNKIKNVRTVNVRYPSFMHFMKDGDMFESYV